MNYGIKKIREIKQELNVLKQRVVKFEKKLKKEDN